MNKYGHDTAIEITCPDGCDTDLWSELCSFQRYTIEEERDHLIDILSTYPNLSDEFRLETIEQFLSIARSI